MTRDGVIYGLGATTLGAIGLAFGDFALQWQPMPKDLPGHHLLALASGGLMLLLGAGMFARATARWAAAGLSAVYLGWTVLHAPAVIAEPGGVGAWLGVCEILTLVAGGLSLFALRAPKPDDRLALATRALMGLCPLVFGLSHFAYATFTAAMVPGWIPYPLFWAYATGTCHLAAGLAILAGVAARPAATLLATMMGGFVVLLHLPRVVAAPGSHLEWTMTAIALSLTGAVWAYRQTLPAAPRSRALAFDRVGLKG